MKVIIVGPSLSGKTALAKWMRQQTDWPISEIDELIWQANGNSWPSSHTYKNEVLVPPIKRSVLESQSVIFFTNTAYFSLQELRQAKEVGFRIVGLKAPLEVLLQRNRKRVAEEGYEDQSRWLPGMAAEIGDLLRAGVIDKVILVNRSLEEVLHELEEYLSARQ